MLVRVLTSSLAGIDAIPVEVETDISQGLPSYTVVGLPAGAVRESGDRIRAAVRNSGFPFPGRKITINLAPAEVRKDGALLDLPIALSILWGGSFFFAKVALAGLVLLVAVMMVMVVMMRHRLYGLDGQYGQSQEGCKPD